MQTEIAVETITSRASLWEFLERWAWYQALPPNLRSLVLRTAKEITAEPSEYIARTGEPCTDWFGVMQGFLQMYVSGASGTETTLCCVKEGDWGGEGSILKNELRKYEI